MTQIEDKRLANHRFQNFIGGALHGAAAGNQQQRIKIALQDRDICKPSHPGLWRCGVNAYRINTCSKSVSFIAHKTARAWKSNNLCLRMGGANLINNLPSGRHNPLRKRTLGNAPRPAVKYLNGIRPSIELANQMLRHTVSD